MTTLAIEGSPAAEHSRAATLVRYLDVLVLVAALPVFVAAGWPLVAYAVVAGIWALQLGVEAYATRRAVRELRAGNRTGAMGWVGATTLGRVWLVVATVLAVGLLDERETGLAAALLSVVLFTIHFGCRFIARAMTPPEQRI